MAPSGSSESATPHTIKQKFLSKLFGRPQNFNPSETSDECEENTEEPWVQYFAEGPQPEQPVIRTSESLRSVTRRISRKVTMDFSCTQSPAYQLSEQRCHLEPVELGPKERRYADRHLHALEAHHRQQGALAPMYEESDSSSIYSSSKPSLGRTSPADKMFQATGGASENLDVDTVSQDGLLRTLSATSSHDELDRTIQLELETTWILNLSMRYRDRSNREKFFITYIQNDRWRRVTVSVDYRNASEDSLETELFNTKLQRQKSNKIYEALRESLQEIQFYDTVTNLKIETIDDRLHLHVVEDTNEIIQYPTIKQVAHLGCRRIREQDLVFDHHLSGYVYKMGIGNTIVVKKDIPAPDSIDEFLYEIHALHSLAYSHNVINIYGLVVDEYDECIKGLLISYANGGALVDILYDNYKDRSCGLSWPLRERWAWQIIRGLADIHESGFVQGDLTLSNIVVDEGDDAKIIDINRRGCPVGWEPPEFRQLIESQQRIAMYVGVTSDLFQLGMILWALGVGEDEPEKEELRPLASRLTTQVPDWYRRVTEICLDADPRKRLQASTLLKLFPGGDSLERHSPAADGSNVIKPMDNLPDKVPKPDTKSYDVTSGNKSSIVNRDLAPQPVDDEPAGRIEKGTDTLKSSIDLDSMPQAALNDTQSTLKSPEALTCIGASDVASDNNPMLGLTDLKSSITDKKQLRNPLLIIDKWFRMNTLSRLIGGIPWITKPMPKPGYRRIVWTCDCGVNLHADFPNDPGHHIDALAFSLQNPGKSEANPSSNISPRSSNNQFSSSSRTESHENTPETGNKLGNSTSRSPTPATSPIIGSETGTKRPMFLGMCVNTGGIYKTLIEIDISSTMSDAAAFLMMKNEYLKTRGVLSRFNFLIKPITVEFVHFALWNLQYGYVSVCDRPKCIPPDDSYNYDYIPKPLKPLPPMPPEIFIHYLEHGEGDLSPLRNDWLPRLPKRLDERVIDSREACYGWGIHIIEGPNREVIFWIVMFTIGASVLTSIMWSAFQSDVQGGAGLGALIVALPPAILTAFLFRLGAL